MSGAVRSGLIFALVGIVAEIAFSSIPGAGPLLCGPSAAMIVGAVAGYFAIRWSTGAAGVGQGVLAGTIAGVGVLIGAVIFFTIRIMTLRSDPQAVALLQEFLRQQQRGTQLSPEQLNSLLVVLGPVLGFCLGLIELLFALALGALGGWLGVRSRARSTVSPPMGPPPLSPPS
jgi:hypothetical protein